MASLCIKSVNNISEITANLSLEPKGQVGLNSLSEY